MERNERFNKSSIDSVTQETFYLRIKIFFFHISHYPDIPPATLHKFLVNVNIFNGYTIRKEEGSGEIHCSSIIFISL